MNMIPDDGFNPMVDPECLARLNEITEGFKKELAVATTPDEAVYLYALLKGYLEEMNREIPSLDEVAPLMLTDGVDMKAVDARVADRLEKEDILFQRELKMMDAKMAANIARAKFGEESEQFRRAVVQCIEYFPDEVKADLDAKARELGLMPAASGYTADNQPVFTAEALAKHFGMEPEQVMQDAGEFAMTVDASTIHRTQ